MGGGTGGGRVAKVDIVVPCYNYGRFLEGCVRSVLEQSCGDLRVLIIDDASSDDSVSVAQKLAHADSRVSVISHPQNWGHIATYNQGIEWASSDYFLLLSADDLLVSGALERAVAVMDANPDIVLTYGKGVSWHDDLPPPKMEAKHANTWTRQDLVREMCVIGANMVNTPTAIGRTCIQKAVGGYRASLPHSGDMEMWLRFGVHGAVAKFDAVQAIYRKHSSNMSSSYWSEDGSDYSHRKAAFDSFFEEYMDRLPEGRGLRTMAYRMLAETAFWRAIGRMRRGYINSGLQLLRFSIDLNPRLRFGPPAGSILRRASTKVFGRT
nr:MULTISPECIES: glycosyltransferase family 2 protein [unclassified Bradyrhizobium]